MLLLDSHHCGCYWTENSHQAAALWRNLWRKLPPWRGLALPPEFLLLRREKTCSCCCCYVCWTGKLVFLAGTCIAMAVMEGNIIVAVVEGL
ncbi:hypothetical protein OIU74_027918 [Salix koriyanagi]|uniref:Uncharacterized protein n=1 Tax=Salix koriyanagi TaxID=2511006 RepID=A0A9Q0ZZX4_9ROSI|nr:hypothetical protein OIU74_027918 [Salix koriyanagi]